MFEDQPGEIRPEADVEEVADAGAGTETEVATATTEVATATGTLEDALTVQVPVASQPFAAPEDAPTVQVPAAFQPPVGAQSAQVPFGLQPPIAPVAVPEPLEPPVPPDPRRVAAVALLNLSGLGLGYALMRRWWAAAGCWLATGILLIVALPAEASGVAGGLLIVYLIILGLAAVLGAVRARRTPPTWPQRPQVALGLAVVLLAVPVGSVVYYQQAQADAIQQMLLGRLSQADRLVAVANGEDFATAQPQYDTALASYRDLLDNHRDSRAGELVPARLATFYQNVAAAYTAKDYCAAIAPLTYLRTLPPKLAAGDLGSLATWPDARLATSLYQCGVGGLGASDSTAAGAATANLNLLLTTFPASSQAAQVEPALAAAINKAAAAVKGADPCGATTLLSTLGSQASALTATGSEAAALGKDSDASKTDVESGTYACGVAQYKGGKFSDSLSTMNNFISNYPHDPNVPLAQKFTIAAQVAQQEPDAGKQLPTMTSGGSISVTVLNDSPDTMTILYTGPATGTFTIGACGSCTTYSALLGQPNACANSSVNYPQVTISLPPGTTYFLQESGTGSTTTPYAHSEQFDDGYDYTDCAYETNL